MNNAVRHRLLTSTLLVGALAVSAPAWAQEQDAPATPPATQASDAGPDIVVTGSRIARPDLQASVPVVSVNAERIQDTGASNVQDVLATLPSVGQNVSRTSSNFSNTGNGVATVNLRNLGASRTLVLINGRRSLGIAGTTFAIGVPYVNSWTSTTSPPICSSGSRSSPVVRRRFMGRKRSRVSSTSC